MVWLRRRSQDAHTAQPARDWVLAAERIGRVLIFLGGLALLAFIVLLALDRALLQTFLNNLLGIGSAFLSVGITLFSISKTIGEWYPVYRKFSDLGIEDGSPSRRGREREETARWIGQLRGAHERIVLAGVTHGGWFVTGWDDFQEALPSILQDISSFEVFLLHPLSAAFDARRRDELIDRQIDLDDTKVRMELVLTHLAQLFRDSRLGPHLSGEDAKLKFYWYQGTPLGVIWTDNTIFLTTYLPCVRDSHCPLLTLTSAGTFSNQVEHSIDNLRRDPRTERILTEEQVQEVLRKLGTA